MPDWTSSMQQTFEYYIVDPSTWKDKTKLDNVKSSSINRDSSVETLGSASLSLTGAIGECYIRIYLITIQNGVREKYPLATVLVQTPSTSFDGKINDIMVDAYTPLIELKENRPPIGFSLFEGENIMAKVCELTREHLRAPVVAPNSDVLLQYDFVSDSSDTWLSFNGDLMSAAKYNYDLDEMGQILFAPKQELAALGAVWEYNDGNSSILYPEITMDRDLYGIPNVVEVLYSDSQNSYYSRIVNDSPNSPISTVNRGREIVHRITNPDLRGAPTDIQIQEYAKQLLRELSNIEYTVSYNHGYCPVRVGDCVRLNYEKAGILGVKAKVISQSIKCEPGTPVSEKAVFTKKLWGD